MKTKTSELEGAALRAWTDIVEDMRIAQAQYWVYKDGFSTDKSDHIYQTFSDLEKFTGLTFDGVSYLAPESALTLFVERVVSSGLPNTNKVFALEAIGCDLSRVVFGGSEKFPMGLV